MSISTIKVLTGKQIEKLKKYTNSKAFQDMQKEAEKKADDIAKGMEFTWEEWSAIKDIPFT